MSPTTINDDNDEDDNNKPLAKVIKGSSNSRAGKVADEEEIPDSWTRPVFAQTRGGRAVKRSIRYTR